MMNGMPSWSYSGKKGSCRSSESGVDEVDMEYCTRSEAMTAVESVIRYRFTDRSLLEAALTHSSFPGADSASGSGEVVSYERLEFIGDSVVGHLLTTHLFTSYPGLDQGALSQLRAANVSTEKLARAAIKLGLYRFLRRNSPSLDIKVMEFARAIECMDTIASVKPPKVLADIVESVAAAVYVDTGYDMDKLWVVLRDMLAPIVTPETLQCHPWTELLELCQKLGKELKTVAKLDRMGANVVTVVVGGAKMGTGHSGNKDIAKNAAAREALEKLKETYGTASSVQVMLEDVACDGIDEGGAKHKLNMLCGKMGWHLPIYRLVGEEGPAHGRKFVSSVEVQTSNGRTVIKGEMKGRVKDSENSAAQKIIYHLCTTEKLSIGL